MICTEKQKANVDQLSYRFSYLNQSPVSGICNEKQKLYGVQFHPEVDLSVNGLSMLRNFLFEIAKVNPSYTMQSREKACIQYIKETVGDHKVLVRCTFIFVYSIV